MEPGSLSGADKNRSLIIQRKKIQETRSIKVVNQKRRPMINSHF